MKKKHKMNKKGGSYRRQTLDILQEEYKHIYKGVVLDIGGRNRGHFKKPKNNIQNWIFADISKENKPDIVLDVTNMNKIDSESIDVINAIELFEHVQEIKVGLKECYRVLKKGGVIIISMPFLHHIHADPFDYQRWTHFKWKEELSKIGFKITKFLVMGKFFTNLAESFRQFILAFSRTLSNLRYFLRIILPFLNILPRLDNKNIVKNDPVLAKYHGGYFIIAKKK